MPTRIESTITVLTSQLNMATVKKGAEIIGKWEADLAKADFTGAKTIHADLGKLRHHLESGTLDSTTIAELLITLGGSTERAATHATGDTVGNLKRLGQALVKAGEGLGGTAHKG